ncbi:SirB1 family protein [Vibrio hangzhouensis]|uniref:Regulator of sirC expression, contains transglutaminase-like and TPR domains n=1 Tax=Vibrio hangzhouensis TaxID=462991 RepID=A0A1H6CLN3_9VIBR|nr:SirB1 family protein [Vibrio hangzhouensis]MBY6197662.1 SirB1 family protein [Vibrio hangzhouensis]SEG73852.1 Regulator of sirC expression, contains transglutaminase-like and TPR domains [Vibrio hangzhouensis]
MIELFDEDFDAIELVEGALILNKAVDPDTQQNWAEAELARLAKEAEQSLFHERDDKQRLDSLLRLFYTEWQFCGDHDAYFSSENAFIDKVLERRKGIPVSLGAILLYLGRKLGMPLEAVTFPTQFLVKVNWPGEAPVYINPYDGEYVSKKRLHAWLIGNDGPLVKLEAKHLATSDNPTVIGRWLALLKSALLREEKYTLALRCTDLALTFVPDDPYEIRDRGYIYQQLDCHQIAATDFQYFIEQCPDDPAIELLKTQVSAINRSPVTLH